MFSLFSSGDLCNICCPAEPQSATQQSKCATLDRQCVLWPLSPPLSLGGPGYADDLPYYIYHCHMFIYGSFSHKWASRQPRFVAQPLPSAFQLGPSPPPDFSPHLTPLSSSFYQPVFPSVLGFCLTLSLTLCNPPTTLTPCYFTPIVPARGGGCCIKVTDLASNWTQHGKAVSSAWLCGTFDKWDCLAGAF